MRTQKRALTVSFPSSTTGTPQTLDIDKKYNPYVQTSYFKTQISLDSTSTFQSENNQDSPIGVSPLKTAFPEASPTGAEMSPTLDHGIGKYLDNFLCLHSTEETIGPGKLKKDSENISILIQQTKKTLLHHDITLLIDLPQKHFGETTNLLKILNCEISLFPEGFLKKLGLKQLSICHKDSSTNNECSLQVDELDTESKISGRLYRIIFDHMIATAPAVMKDWDKLMKTNGFRENESFIKFCSLQEVFIALFRDFHYASLEQLKKSAKELLLKHYPEELTEEWFEWRNATKKKMRRSSFNLD